MRPLRSPHGLVILTGYALGAFALYWGLPPTPPYWIVDGERTFSVGTPMLAFLLPTAIAATDALLRGLCLKHPVGERTPTQALGTYDAIMLRFSAFVMGVHAVAIFASLGFLRDGEWTARIVPLMLGFTLMAIGNLLPRTRPNLAIGIRTRGTLSDRALWIRTHRFAGYVVVACGVVVVLSAAAVPGPIGRGMILLVGPAALLATWRVSRAAEESKKLEAGS